jgi:predicted RNase H-like HicB family nuclease
MLLGVQFTAAITHEGDLFVARCLEVEVTSQGDSSEGAVENLKEALELYFEGQAEPISIENPIVTTFQLSA